MKQVYYKFKIGENAKITIRFSKSDEQSVKEIMFESVKYENLLSPTEKAKLFVEYRIQNTHDYAQHLLRKAKIDYELVYIIDYVIE